MNPFVLNCFAAVVLAFALLNTGGFVRKCSLNVGGFATTTGDSVPNTSAAALAWALFWLLTR